MKIKLDGSIGNKGHVFIYDENDKLRCKFWFHGNGNIIWRNFNDIGQTVESGNMDAISMKTTDKRNKLVDSIKVACLIFEEELLSGCIDYKTLKERAIKYMTKNKFDNCLIWLRNWGIISEHHFPTSLGITKIVYKIRYEGRQYVTKIYKEHWE
jgi:hypothetical protein